jgi:hypothetical protein
MIFIILFVIGGYFFSQRFYAIQEFFSKEPPSEEVPILNPVVPESHKEPTAISTIVPPPLLEAIKPVEMSPVSEPTIAESHLVPNTQETVNTMIERAKEQLARQRFTSPAGDNAYETSQQLAKIAPEPAQEIVNAIVNWYLEQGQRYLLDKDRLLKPEQRNALEMYQRAQEIAPEHPQVKEGIDKIVKECRRLASNYQKSGKKEQGLHVVEKGLTLRPQDQELLNLREKLAKKPEP